MSLCKASPWDVQLPDPPHPSCMPPESPRVALALYGGVSRRHGKFDPQAFDGLENYVNVTLAFEDLRDNVMHPSGGVDVFMHSRVASLPLQKLLVELYSPMAVKFETIDKGRHEKFENSAMRHGMPQHEESRWDSIARVLEMVNEEERKHNSTYSHIYLTRPDLGIWKHVDVRRYCPNTFYFNHCFQPFWPYQCQADFHFVMGSALARHFIRIHDYFDKGVARFTGRQGHLTNDEIKQFVHRMGSHATHDHVVVQRHEEVLRKGGDTLFREKYRKTFL